MFDYLRDPQAIYARSFELVREHTDLDRVPTSLHDIVIRLVHACGQPELVDELRWSSSFGTAARAALQAGFLEVRKTPSASLQEVQLMDISQKLLHHMPLQPWSGACGGPTSDRSLRRTAVAYDGSWPRSSSSPNS